MGPGTGRRGSSVDALVGMTDGILALVVPVIIGTSDEENVSTPDAEGTSGESWGVDCGSAGTTDLDGIRPVCTGAVIMASGDDCGSSGSIARTSDGIMLDVRGAEGMSPDGNDV